MTSAINRSRESLIEKDILFGWQSDAGKELQEKLGTSKAPLLSHGGEDLDRAEEADETSQCKQ